MTDTSKLRAVTANVPVYKKAEKTKDGNKFIGDFEARVSMKTALLPGDPGLTCEIRVNVTNEDPEAGGKKVKETVRLNPEQVKPYLRALGEVYLDMCAHSFLVVTRPADLENTSK